mmetsp:Transcript_2272/g.8298  ORF Transcript_2272/g.8298 Transcript_2272/m.8298 type:complete len:207 (+) Transcript_2272:1704-2324(+)
MPNVGPWLGCRIVVTTLRPSSLPKAWQRPMVVVDLPSPRGVGLMPATTTSDPRLLESPRRARTASWSTLALWRPQCTSSLGSTPHCCATSASGRGSHACEMSISCGTGESRSTWTLARAGETLSRFAAATSASSTTRVAALAGARGGPPRSCRSWRRRALSRSCRSQSLTVFFSSMAIVTGPTPPGTGVSFDATNFAPSATSPTRR